MEIVLFTHPSFQGSESMPKYARMLCEGLEKRGNIVVILTAEKFFYNFPAPAIFKKWLGYVDQFIIFPIQLRRKIRRMPRNTLFVFADHALGPWVPLVSDRPHVIHCHDFLAQFSALGKIPENNVGFTGKIYQTLIRSGYKEGKNFISISKKTQVDLHGFLGYTPDLSRIVYNGLNQDFQPGCFQKARRILQEEFKINLQDGFILHIGGNQFYKNKKGLIEIYSSWRDSGSHQVPLLMVGPPPTDELLRMKRKSTFVADIYFLTNVSDDLVKELYLGATMLLFPSLEEGFGWPIAEAMASGCPVVTTDKPPMNEIGGRSCFYIPPYPTERESLPAFYSKSAKVLNRVFSMSPEERRRIIQSGLVNSKRFDTDKAINKIESVYHKVLKIYK